jgi:hypothetical protein
MKLNLSAICNKFSTKGYNAFKIVLLHIPISIYFPAYPGNYLGSSKEKLFSCSIHGVQSNYKKTMEVVEKNVYDSKDQILK